jgi:HEAT repeat protein
VRAISQESNTGNDARLQRLINDLRSEDREVRRKATLALEKLESKAAIAVPALLEVLDEALKEPPDRGLLWCTTQALGNIGSADAVPSLVVCLGNEEAREGAIHALSQLGPKASQAVPTLVTMLGDKDFYERQFVIRALGNIGPSAKAAVPVLMKELEHKSYGNRSIAAESLGKIGVGSPSVISGLSRLLNDKSPYVRESAAIALSRIGAPAKFTIPALLNLFADREEYVRVAAANAVAKIDQAHPKIITPLTNLLADQDMKVREAAVRALAAIGADARVAVPVILKSLEDWSPSYRIEAVKALEKIDKKAIARVPPAPAPGSKESDFFAELRKIQTRYGGGPLSSELASRIFQFLRTEENRIRFLETFESIPDEHHGPCLHLAVVECTHQGIRFSWIECTGDHHYHMPGMISLEGRCLWFSMGGGGTPCDCPE